ncbi:phasin family protein [uncultured Rhodoblastus sp.]|uniref:phasin family protein n=1 Tax=uncultured Rhodoblastus sp. TaxID=543037 RepID=UPI0025F89EA6|nr:phasin family protein [uncultured Rhodoblastus sp.]
MANPTIEQISNDGADTLSRSAQTAKKIAIDSSNTLAESGKGSAAALKDLTGTYQELASNNVKSLTAAVAALVAVKSPSEFLALQQKLIKDGLETAANDSRRIAELTTAVFTAAFDPVKKQIETAQHNAKG